MSPTNGISKGPLRSAWRPPFTFLDNGAYDVRLYVTDAFGAMASQATVANIANAPPEVGVIDAALDPAVVGTAVAAHVDFADPGVLDTHTIAWDWGDGTVADGTVTEAGGCGSAYGSHVYSDPGVYTITAFVTDNDGDTGTSTFEFVVVYDPSAGFVTGGGVIDSPRGAFTAEPTLFGKASFGFVSKYKRGASVPDGATEFQFKAGGLNFHSNTQEWLVVNRGGKYAQYKCTGTINGDFGPGSDPFEGMIWAGDGYGPDGSDTFRIRIWYEDADGTEVVVYDNGMDQPISSGSIVVHTK